MTLVPIVLSLTASICIFADVLHLIFVVHRRKVKLITITSSLPILLNLELEQNALLLYSR